MKTACRALLCTVLFIRFLEGHIVASADNKIDRVTQMLLDTGQTWELSANDKDAIRHVLGVVNSMACELAEYTGVPIPEVVNRHEAIVSYGVIQYNAWVQRAASKDYAKPNDVIAAPLQPIVIRFFVLRHRWH